MTNSVGTAQNSPMTGVATGQQLFDFTNQGAVMIGLGRQIPPPAAGRASRADCPEGPVEADIAVQASRRSDDAGPGRHACLFRQEIGVGRRRPTPGRARSGRAGAAGPIPAPFPSCRPPEVRTPRRSSTVCSTSRVSSDRSTINTLRWPFKVTPSVVCAGETSLSRPKGQTDSRFVQRLQRRFAGLRLWGRLAICPGGWQFAGQVDNLPHEPINAAIPFSPTSTICGIAAIPTRHYALSGCATICYAMGSHAQISARYASRR